MSILERALHMGEGKKFKELQKRVGRINDYEPETELLEDRRAQGGVRRPARARGRRRVARRPPLLLVRADPRGRQARPRPAPLRRPADRRHGAARRLDRRDEDRRGQDPHLDARGLPQRARRQGRPPRHGQRLPRPPRRRVDEADLRHARHLDRHPPVRPVRPGAQARRLRAATSPTAPTPSSASTTCATTSPTRRKRRSSASTTSRSSTRSTTSSSTRRGRR